MKRLCAPCFALALAGCVSFSGLDGSSEYSCKAPPGMPCQSLSGVASNYEAGNLPYQQQAQAASAAASPMPNKPASPAVSGTPASVAPPVPVAPPAQTAAGPESDRRISPRSMEAPSSGMPIRQPPLVLRIWIAPWEDESGDLHDQSYVYTMINPGRWLIDANRSRIQQEYRPIIAPRKSSPPASAPARPAGTSTETGPATPVQGS